MDIKHTQDDLDRLTDEAEEMIEECKQDPASLTGAFAAGVLATLRYVCGTSRDNPLDDAP